MRKVVSIAVGFAAAFLMVGCGDESSPSGPSNTKPAYVGVWEADVDLTAIGFGLLKLSYTVNENNSFEFKSTIDNVVQDMVTGTWTASADSIFLKATSCKELDEETNALADVPCVDPLDSEDSDTEAFALSGISGNTWTIPIEQGGSIKFTKK